MARLAGSRLSLEGSGTSDPRDRSKLVGEKISELRKSCVALTEDQRAELGADGQGQEDHSRPNHSG